MSGRLAAGRNEAPVLVVTDNASDAQQVLKQLEATFTNVRASAPDKAVAQFSEFEPKVLVLAFDTLEKSQQFYLGLFRLREGLSLRDHETVVLCQKEDVPRAFELCLSECFDDYVQYWPHSYDGPRLLMSVWAASRHATSGAPLMPRPAELLAHGKHLDELERIVAARDATTAAQLREEIGPPLAGTRVLGETIRSLKPTVLVVDDDPFARRLTQVALDPTQWTVVLANDGAQALTQLRRIRPDVMLVDIQMPGMSGIELTKHLKSSPDLAAIPVVMMTANALRESVNGSMDAGAAAFVVKPVTRESLAAKLALVIPR